MPDIVEIINENIEVVITDDGVTLIEVGVQGAQGIPGQGVPIGGSTSQVLAKTSGADYATAWVNPSGGGGITDGDKGDITVTSSGATWTIDSAAVTYAKIQASTAGSIILGKGAGASGTLEQLTIGSGLGFSGTILNVNSVLVATTASFTTAQETKLAGIAIGATANSSDATLLSRINHTGAQAISTITGLQTALDSKIDDSQISAFGLTLVDDVDATTARTTLGLGTAATQASTAFEVPLTFSTGLTRATNTITINTSQNISTLSNLTANGFVKTSGSTGSLSVDTSTFLTGNESITLSGDITGTGTTAITGTLANDAVTTNKIQHKAVTLLKIQHIQSGRFLGRTTVGLGDTEELTGTQATSLLDTFSTSLKGLAPASGGGATNFLRADGIWAAPSGGGGLGYGKVYAASLNLIRS